MAKTSPKAVARQQRIKRVRSKVSGTPERPRLRVFRSAKHIYAQIIDDAAGNTLVSMSSLESGGREVDEQGKRAVARKIGLLLAEKARAKGIEKVVFDKGGYIYHGRIKSLSDGAREGGLIF